MTEDSDMGLIRQVQHALTLSNAGLGKAAGVSVRTVQRWWAASGGMLPGNFRNLAVAVHPHDPVLAGKLAARAGTTLDALGLAVPASAPAPRPVSRLHVDAVVCAAAEAVDLSPRAMRRALTAAFAYATQAGVDVAALARELAAAPAPRRDG